MSWIKLTIASGGSVLIDTEKIKSVEEWEASTHYDGKGGNYARIFYHGGSSLGLTLAETLDEVLEKLNQIEPKKVTADE